MSAVTLDFLRLVQGAGWQIESASERAVIARCPTDGCGMRARLVPGGPIPDRLPPDHSGDIVIETAEQARRALEARRQSLCLSIRETEDVAGVTVDHLAKIEAEIRLNPQLTTLITIANTLGLDVVFRPMPLPPQVLRVLAETRSIERRRAKVFAKRRR